MSQGYEYFLGKSVEPTELSVDNNNNEIAEAINNGLASAEKLTEISVENKNKLFRSNALTEEEKQKLEKMLKVSQKQDLDILDMATELFTSEQENTDSSGDDVEQSQKGDNNSENSEEITNLRLPRLEVICDRFCRRMTEIHSNIYKSRIEWNLIAIDQEKFGVTIRSLPVPTNITVLQATAFHAPILSIMDSRLVFELIESAMGAPCICQPRIEGREFTKIEQLTVIDKSQKAIADCLTQAWSEAIADIEFSPVRHEVNPQFAAIVPHDEDCVVIRYEVEMNQCLGSALQIIPKSAINSYVEFLSDKNSHRLITVSDDEFVDKINRKKENERERKTSSSINDCDKNLRDFLRNVYPVNLIKVLYNEHPQTLACVASLMCPNLAARFILELQSEIRPEVIRRIDNLEVKNKEFLGCILDVLYNSKLSDNVKSDTNGNAVLAVLSHLDPESYKEIKQDLQEDKNSTAAE